MLVELLSNPRGKIARTRSFSKGEESAEEMAEEGAERLGEGSGESGNGSGEGSRGGMGRRIGRGLAKGLNKGWAVILFQRAALFILIFNLNSLSILQT